MQIQKILPKKISDIKVFPQWIDKELALLEAHPEVFKPEEEPQKAEFRKLLEDMKATSKKLLDIRSRIQRGLEKTIPSHPASR